MKELKLTLCLLLIFTLVSAQDKTFRRNSFLTGGFNQINEEANCGKSTAQWADEVLFDKLQIKNLTWEKYKDGVTFGGFGILTTPRELAKFGQCVLNNGHGGQYVCITPSKKLIVVMTAEVNTQGEFQFGKEAFVWVDRIVKIME